MAHGYKETLILRKFPWKPHFKQKPRPFIASRASRPCVPGVPIFPVTSPSAYSWVALSALATLDSWLSLNTPGVLVPRDLYVPSSLCLEGSSSDIPVPDSLSPLSPCSNLTFPMRLLLPIRLKLMHQI